MTRFALGIEYDGHTYSGWQAQTGLQTIQGTLEIALTKIAAEPVKIFCAGRTDAGVHGIGQVVHFDTNAVRVPHAWTLGTNTHLPANIAVRWAEEVDSGFHARFSALSRRYRYVIYNSPIRSAVLAARVTWARYALDVDRMQLAANYLIGEHDFSSFRSSNCESKTPIRHVREIKVWRENDYVIFEIEANAFLHHMVRNIAGVLIRVGRGQDTPESVQQILHARDRRVAFETAPATGLYFIEVRYPEVYLFPTAEKPPLFLLR
jgi:tRNA pseudouridine38-40 synthase